MAGEAEAPWPACCSCWCCSSTVPRCGPPPSPAPHKQHTSVILHCKMCHTTCSDIQAVICNHRNSTPPLFCTVKCVTLKYSSSYLQPQKQHTSVILHCKMCHTQIFLQLPAALELCVYGVTDLYVDCKVMVISQIKM